MPRSFPAATRHAYLQSVNILIQAQMPISFIGLLCVLAAVFYLMWLGDLRALGSYIIFTASCMGIIAIGLARLKQVVLLFEGFSSRIKDRMTRLAGAPAEEQEEEAAEEEATTAEPGSLESLIRANLIPRMQTYSGIDAVCGIAAETISEAHAATEDAYRFVTFYGSASLSTIAAQSKRFGKRRDIEERDEDFQSPEQIYRGALEAAASDQMRIRRYIRLFTPEEFDARGQATRREYVEWIEAQYHQLMRNPNYRLTDVVRAPLWGSNVARIVTNFRLLEIVGDGEAGLLIIGEDVADAIRRHSREAVLGRGQTKNAPIHYSQGTPWTDTPGEWRTVEQYREKVMTPIKEALQRNLHEGEH